MEEKKDRDKKGHEDLPELIKFVKTQPSSHEIRVKSKNANDNSRTSMNEYDKSILSKTDSTISSESDMKESSQLNSQFFPQQESKHVPIVTEEKGGAISAEFGSGIVFLRGR